MDFIANILFDGFSRGKKVSEIFYEIWACVCVVIFLCSVIKNITKMISTKNEYTILTHKLETLCSQLYKYNIPTKKEVKMTSKKEEKKMPKCCTIVRI